MKTATKMTCKVSMEQSRYFGNTEIVTNTRETETRLSEGRYETVIHKTKTETAERSMGRTETTGRMTRNYTWGRENETAGTATIKYTREMPDETWVTITEVSWSTATTTDGEKGKAMYTFKEPGMPYNVATDKVVLESTEAIESFINNLFY